jgi:hypothetical protein
MKWILKSSTLVSPTPFGWLSELDLRIHFIDDPNDVNGSSGSVSLRSHMTANETNSRPRLVRSRGDLIIYAVILVVSVLTMFLLAHDRNIVALAVKSLFFSVPSILIYGSLQAARAHFVEFEKNRRWSELAVIALLLLSIAFYLLLIVLAARTLMT